MRSFAVVMALAACASLAACKGEKASPPPPPVAPHARAQPTAAPAPEPDDPHRDLNWSTVSADASALLTQEHLGPDDCLRRCKDGPGGKEIWSARGCIGNQLDLRFVANDCGKVVVLHPLPKARATQLWKRVMVAHVYERDQLAYAVAAGAVVRDWKQIRSAGNTFYWLAGAMDVPGPAPRYSADGTAVVIETIDGKQQSIPLK